MADTVTVTKEVVHKTIRHALMRNNSHPLFDTSLLGKPDEGTAERGLQARMLAKASGPGKAALSNLKESRSGIIAQPVDFALLVRMRAMSIHHERSIGAKVNALVGMGFESEAIADKLDKLCGSATFYEICNDAAFDFWEDGNGMLEVVKDGASRIRGIHHLASANVFAAMEKDKGNKSTGHWHWVVQADTVTGNGVLLNEEQHFARWGERERLYEFLVETQSSKYGDGDRQIGKNQISEVVHIRQPNNISKLYGMPMWTSIVPSIEILQSLDQFHYDYFQNFGAIAQLLLFLGAELDTEDWADIVRNFSETIKTGGGNKGMVLNLPQQNLTVEKIDMAMDVFTEGMREFDRDKIADIMSGHGVPSLVAGVSATAKVVFAKSGEARETLQLFQATTIAAPQNLWTGTLERTIGSVIKIPKITHTVQEVSGVTQEMVKKSKSGWTLKSIVDEVEFDMTPQLGGPGTKADGDKAGTDK